MKQSILDLLSGQKIESQPAFSGLIHITEEGLKREGLVFHEIHTDARKMARAAASTFRLSGLPSAALPLDLCLPAQALGAELNYYQGGDIQFPQVKRALVQSVIELGERTSRAADATSAGRVGLACEAIRLVKADIGTEIVISGMIPGPYTLLLYLCDAKNLFQEMKKQPSTVSEILLGLASWLAQIGNAYRAAGADFITIHEMGGSPGFIGPPKFEQFVLPALKELHRQLPAPRVLSVCGNTNKSMHMLAESAADAISVDQTNDLAASRAALSRMLLFGNLDPVATLFRGEIADVAAANVAARAAGVDAVWPGCDLVPETAIQNIRTMQET